MTNNRQQGEHSFYSFREYEQDAKEGSPALLEANLIWKDADDRWTIQQQQQHGQASSSIFHRFISRPRQLARELFLPLGYPASVRDGYWEYQCYDSLQGLCSYLRGVLCSAQVLQAAGVGNEAATAWGAALTWAMKDGLAMIGGLVFSYVAAPQFDSHVKEFRLFADLINDVALTLDMVAPYFAYDARALLLVSAASTLGKTLCGMSAAATKANITVYFAHKGDNMADLNAKEATQETLVSLVGMLLGVTLARWLLAYEQSHPKWTQQIQWFTFVVLTVIHVWSNWKGVCILHLPTLNRERAECVLTPLVLKATASDMEITDDHNYYSYLSTEIPSPTDVSESLVSSAAKMLWPGRLHLNAQFSDMITKCQPSRSLLNWFVVQIKYHYILTVDRKDNIYVCLLQGAGANDEIQAFCHALMLLQKTSLTEETIQYYGQVASAWIRHAKYPLTERLSRAGWEIRPQFGFARRRTALVLSSDKKK